MAAGRHDRARAEVVMLAHRGLSVPDYARAAMRALRRAVPFDGSCVLTLDPATLLPTSELSENALPPTTRRRMTEIELAEPDYNKFTALARSPSPAASLSAATGGRLERSRRQRELRRPGGFGDELRVTLRDDGGSWGAVTLLRERGRAHFSPAEVRLVASMAGELAAGLRRAVLVDAVARDGAEAAHGFLVLDADDGIALANAAAERWLGELRSGPGLPVVIRSVAARARRAAGGEPPEELARARVRTPRGDWLLVHGSVLGAGPAAPAAIVLEAARAAELAPLIADAVGLTPRERLVTQLVARGLGTAEIGRRLHLSPYTVQDHLKSIFEKTGVSTRGELVARLFFEHHVPRRAAG